MSEAQGRENIPPRNMCGRCEGESRQNRVKQIILLEETNLHVYKHIWEKLVSLVRCLQRPVLIENG